MTRPTTASRRPGAAGPGELRPPHRGVQQGRCDAARPEGEAIVVSARSGDGTSSACANACSNWPAGTPSPKAYSSRARATCRRCAARASIWPGRRAGRAGRRGARSARRGTAPRARCLWRDHRRLHGRRPARRDLRPLLYREVKRCIAARARVEALVTAADNASTTKARQRSTRNTMDIAPLVQAMQTLNAEDAFPPASRWTSGA